MKLSPGPITPLLASLILLGCETASVEPLPTTGGGSFPGTREASPAQRAAQAERAHRSQTQARSPQPDRSDRREPRGDRPTPVRSARHDTPATDGPPPSAAADPDEQRSARSEITRREGGEPMGTVRAMRVRANLLPRGSVPYDNLSLPLTSPCGRYLATQTGLPPTWETLLAAPYVEPPYGTDVVIYELDLESRDAVRIATIEVDAVLGRSVNQRGFLIESPREDGSRWIGFVDWVDGELMWLIDDDAVNAFAVLGEDGRLAWSRREPDRVTFELVIWDGQYEHVISSDESTDWVMPTWSPSGSGLFVFTLSETGRMDLVYGLGSDERAFRQSRQRLQLVREGNIFGAYQAVNGQVSSPDLTTVSSDHLVFFHPGAGRVCVWTPLAARGEALTMLMRGSMFAILESADRAAVTTEDGLYRQNLNDLDDRAEMVRGTLLPRLTHDEAWPYLLLAPGENSVGLTSMRLLPIE